MSESGDVLCADVVVFEPGVKSVDPVFMGGFTFVFAHEYAEPSRS